MDIVALRQFDTRNSKYAKIYTLEQFLDLNERRKILPYDGCIDCVLVNGNMMNILVTNWDCSYDWVNNFVYMSLRDLEQFYPDIVQIVWYSK